MVSWFFWLFENAGKLARGIFWGLRGLQGIGKSSFFLFARFARGQNGAFLGFAGLARGRNGAFLGFARAASEEKGGFFVVSRCANLLRGSFSTLCTVCKPLARGIFSREAEVTTRKVGESQTFCSFYLFKKGWKSWCFSLECECFTCVAYEDVNVATGDVCDV